MVANTNYNVKSLFKTGLIHFWELYFGRPADKLNEFPHFSPNTQCSHFGRCRGTKWLARTSVPLNNGKGVNIIWRVENKHTVFLNSRSNDCQLVVTLL